MSVGPRRGLRLAPKHGLQAIVKVFMFVGCRLIGAVALSQVDVLAFIGMIEYPIKLVASRVLVCSN